MGGSGNSHCSDSVLPRILDQGCRSSRWRIFSFCRSVLAEQAPSRTHCVILPSIQLIYSRRRASYKNVAGKSIARRLCDWPSRFAHESWYAFSCRYFTILFTHCQVARAVGKIKPVRSSAGALTDKNSARFVIASFALETIQHGRYFRARYTNCPIKIGSQKTLPPWRYMPPRQK